MFVLQRSAGAAQPAASPPPQRLWQDNAQRDLHPGEGPKAAHGRTSFTQFDGTICNTSIINTGQSLRSSADGCVIHLQAFNPIKCLNSTCAHLSVKIACRLSLIATFFSPPFFPFCLWPPRSAHFGPLASSFISRFCSSPFPCSFLQTSSQDLTASSAVGSTRSPEVRRHSRTRACTHDLSRHTHTLTPPVPVPAPQCHPAPCTRPVKCEIPPPFITSPPPGVFGTA